MPLKVENLSKLYISLFEKWYFDKGVNFDVRDFSALISAIAGEYGQGVCWMVPECIKNIHLISIDIKGDVALVITIHMLLWVILWKMKYQTLWKKAG